MRQPTYRIAYKAAAVLLLLYALLAGVLLELPRVGDLEQSSRSLFYHLPMWFGMYTLMLLSMVFSIAYLRKGHPKWDIRAAEAAKIGIWFGLLGLGSGMVWSRVTWGQLMPDTDPTAWWVWDPKQSLALAAVLIYLAYLVLRGSLEETTRRAKISAVYNIFACAGLFPLTYIIPRQLQSLHPGSAGSDTVFGNEYRLVLYPAAVGFILLGLWLWELRVRQRTLHEHLADLTAH
jgi:heme exporter protein C